MAACRQLPGNRGYRRHGNLLSPGFVRLQKSEKYGNQGAVRP